MDSKKKVTISWSGGKDSALALYHVLQDKSLEVVGLHTVFNAQNLRVGLHGVHERLIERQAAALGLPLTKIYLEESETHDVYREVMSTFYRESALSGIDAVVFGDIFLEDLKAFRENLLRDTGLDGVYPLWRMKTAPLMEQFLSLGFRTLVCAADAMFFLPGDVGQTIDYNFLKRMPAEVDVCGENGEFHTFVFDGPIFRTPVKVEVGEPVTRSYRYSVKTAEGGIKELSKNFLFCELR